MRNMYVLLFSVVVIILLLLIFTFIFFEKGKHEGIFYSVEKNGERVGHIKTDRYKTEDKIIYKSVFFNPKSTGRQITRQKISFYRENFGLERYSRESKGFGVISEGVYIRNNGESFDFVAQSGSKFSALSKISHPVDISVFDERAPVTYMPLVDKYDFTKGGAQEFEVLYNPLDLLPPARLKAVMTSIRDEYINVDGKKTRTELLVVRAKPLPKVHIWVSKGDKSIARLQVETGSLLLKKVAFPLRLDIWDYRPSSTAYALQEVLFPSGDIALGGGLAVPKKEGSLPAALLVAGEKNYDRENAGLYTDIRDDLANNGYVVLSFDPRGIGKSQGEVAAAGLSEEVGDIQSSLRFLFNHKRVDRKKVFIVAHGDGCSLLSQVDYSELPVRGIVFLGVTRPRPILDFESERVLARIKEMSDADKDYSEMIGALKQETINIVQSSGQTHAAVGGRRVFVKRMRELMDFDPLEGFKGLSFPIIIVQGKRDGYASFSYIKEIEKIMQGREPPQFTPVYFRGLGHFLGELAAEKGMRDYYRANREVLEIIRDWLAEHSRDAVIEEGAEGAPEEAPEQPADLTNT